MVSDFGYTTVADVGAALQTTFDGTTTPTDTQVESWISEAEAIINKYADRPFSQETYTQEKYDHNGTRFITLQNQPVISVSTIEYTTDGGDSWTALTSDDYYLDTRFSRIERDLHNGSNWPGRGYQNVRITYDAGYSSVPVDIQRLAKDMAVSMVIESIVDKGANSEGGRISVGAISIDKSDFSPNVLSQKNSNIQSRLDKLSSGRAYTTIGKRFG